jgi:transposase-like protein
MKPEGAMATITRRQYTEDLKQEAVRLVRASARPVAQVTRDLGSDSGSDFVSCMTPE